MASDFTRRVVAATRRIPAGRIATYGDIAAMAGVPRAARAVGNIMRACRLQDVPCHRVVAAGGRLGGFGGYVALKRELLRAEGVPASGSRIRRWQAYRWPASASRSAGHGRPRRNRPGRSNVSP
jgi:O-6-methylguanine DNA methyltransferase